MMGGFLSIFLIVGLLAVFYTKVINTLNMMSINSTTNSQIADDPTPLALTSRG
jgi:hypothetical protein